MPKNTIKNESTLILPDISEENNFFRYSLVLEYAGWAFSGSQKQLNAITVQDELEKAINLLLQKNTKTIFSGRTDKGVNAKNQVMHFDSPFKINLNRFLHSLNAILPEQISVKSVQQVNKTFHSQKSARFRWYRYTINNRPQRSVWLNNISCHIYGKLHIEEMQKALDFIKGRHDFSSFKKVNSPNPAKECTIFYAACREKSGIIYIDLIADRFLYNMVRIITGTLIKIGKKLFPPEHMLRILEARDRCFAGPTAEAGGLTLMMVGYDEKYNLRSGFANL